MSELSPTTSRPWGSAVMPQPSLKGVCGWGQGGACRARWWVRLGAGAGVGAQRVELGNGAVARSTAHGRRVGGRGRAQRQDADVAAVGPLQAGNLRGQRGALALTSLSSEAPLQMRPPHHHLCPPNYLTAGALIPCHPAPWRPRRHGSHPPSRDQMPPIPRFTPRDCRSQSCLCHHHGAHTT